MLVLRGCGQYTINEDLTFLPYSAADKFESLTRQFAANTMRNTLQKVVDGMPTEISDGSVNGNRHSFEFIDSNTNIKKEFIKKRHNELMR